jgi:hypothetical protein
MACPNYTPSAFCFGVLPVFSTQWMEMAFALEFSRNDDTGQKVAT